MIISTCFHRLRINPTIRSSSTRYQRGGECDPTVCGGSAELVVLRQPSRRYCQRDAVQHRRNSSRQRQGTLLVSAKALRGTPNGSLRRRDPAASPVPCRRSLTRHLGGVRHPVTKNVRYLRSENASPMNELGPSPALSDRRCRKNAVFITNSSKSKQQTRGLKKL